MSMLILMLLLTLMIREPSPEKEVDTFQGGGEGSALFGELVGSTFIGCFVSRISRLLMKCRSMICEINASIFVKIETSCITT